MTWETKVLRGRAGLEELEASWHALRQQLPDAGFIHDAGWCKSQLLHGEPDPDRVIFVVVSSNGQTVAIAPLRPAVTRRFGMPLRTWEIFWPNDMGLCDFVFAKREANDRVLEAVTRALRADRDERWDLLRLQDIREDSNLAYAWSRRQPGLSILVPHHYSKQIVCDADYETVMGRLSGHFRRNLRRQTKKLNELPGIEYRFVTRIPELNDALEHFLQVEAASWKGEQGTSTAVALFREKVEFYRTLVEEFARQDACAINLILRGGQCIAAQLCLAVNGTLHLLKISYDEQYQAMGPGNVLLGELVKRVCADGKIGKISFVTGAAWNDNWAPEVVNVYHGQVFNRTVRGLMAYGLERTKHVGRQVKHWMQRIRSGGGAAAAARVSNQSTIQTD